MPGEIPDTLLRYYQETGDIGPVVQYISERNISDAIYWNEYQRVMEIEQAQQEKPGILKRIFGR